jgi:hypothetical protein
MRTKLGGLGGFKKHRGAIVNRNNFLLRPPVSHVDSWAKLCSHNRRL